MDEITRADKLERHFRNSVREALMDLMQIMDPGNQRNWNYQNYAELLRYARDRIDAELTHELGEDANEEITPGAPDKPVPTRSLALPESAVRVSES